MLSFVLLRLALLVHIGATAGMIHLTLLFLGRFVSFGRIKAFFCCCFFVVVAFCFLVGLLLVVFFFLCVCVFCFVFVSLFFVLFCFLPTE